MSNASVVQGASLEAIQHHYDVGNDFYSLWLDSSKTYSCAMWEGVNTLEEAQSRKIDFHIEQARAQGVSRVLDIGCGWGATLRRLVDSADVRCAIGLTLSDAQAKWISARSDSRTKVVVQSWADHQPDEDYDAIISVGAFEHFATPEMTKPEVIAAYRHFFSKCHAWLKPGGYLSLQTIAYGRAGREDLNKFILDKIFPESDLPRLSDIDEGAKNIFEIVSHRNDRLDYERTLREWYFRLRRNKDAAIKMVGAEKVAHYEKYLSLFMIGFHTGAMNLLRLTMRKESGSLTIAR